MAKNISQEQKDLYNSIVKDVKKANQRLVRLERTYGQDSWASKRLASRLDTDKVQAFTNQGRIRINQSMSIDQMLAIRKAISQFLSSKTSLISGVKETVARSKEEIKKSVSVDDDEISDEDVEDLYDLLDNPDFEYLSKGSTRGHTDLWNLLQDAKDGVIKTKRDFMDALNDIIDISNDAEGKAKATRLYNKFKK